ncbi:MAG: chemotaxis protein CheX [Acidobacteria bacterium]|nr:chemotaxis protein CheX [Acidobacteriota bacterium]
MADPALDNLIIAAVAEVLETMFFTEILQVGGSHPSLPALGARVAFTGHNSGIVSIRISEAAARSLTASFLGESEESLSQTQVANLVCELANMLCGCIVSKMAAHGCFTLDSPELIDGSTQESTERPEIRQSFAIERGSLTVSLNE